MFRRSVTIVSLGIAAAIMSGCGGGSSTSDGSNNNSDTGIGYYIDSAVSGISYTCGSKSGVTGADGSFTFEKGQSCTFKLGDITLRSVTADSLVDKVKIVEDRVEVAQLLQTLDADGNPDNGITIPATVVEKMQEHNITALPDTEAKLKAVFAAVRNAEGYQGEFKTVQQAEGHLKKTQSSILKELLAGKIVYDADYSAEEDYIDQTTFSADMKSLTWTELIGNDQGQQETENFTIDGNKLIFSDGTYHILAKQTADYLLMNDFNEDGTSDGTTRLYFDRAKVDAYYNSLKNGGGSSNTNNINMRHLQGTTVYEVYFDGTTKNIGKIEFLTDNSLKWTALVGQDEGQTGTVNFTATQNSITADNGDLTTFTPVIGKPYFMTGAWVSGDKTETDTNYYFHTKAEAEAFTLSNNSPTTIDMRHLHGTTVYEVFFDGANKNIGKIEFLTDTSLKFTGLVGQDVGETGTVNFTATQNSITADNGDKTTFTPVTGKPYFMTGVWVSGDKTETDNEYYFQTEAAAKAFVLP